ncbi:MAG: CDP-alcohol phosphatidyltransferase family protein [Myxococcales bacterium]|nr:CDP-alcohol phosphatidyltransferase family protein [Myxococcota bacterium]MDW8284262.1 CDP-alcohol phosphatidyltransferase family protein [Myxococcales bacterium]
MCSVRTLRYLVPNAVTALSIVFAVLAIQAAVRGEIVWGAWWALYSTLTDKLDGALARWLRASSPLGMQLDSLADLLNYGLAPATLTYALFARERALGWSEGLPYVLLCTICVVYVLCTALRLARFNISPSNPSFFFGIPSTMSGASVLSILITLGKYGDPAWTAGERYAGPRLLGQVRLDGVMPFYPLLLLAFGVAMVSRWRVPKVGHLRSRAANVYVIGNLMVGYTCGLLRTLPEYLAFGLLQYVFIAGYAHFFTTPKVRPEPLFPKE